MSIVRILMWVYAYVNHPSMQIGWFTCTFKNLSQGVKEASIPRVTGGVDDICIPKKLLVLHIIYLSCLKSQVHDACFGVIYVYSHTHIYI